MAVSGMRTTMRIDAACDALPAFALAAPALQQDAE
jgi:hypothetical protein